MIWRRWVTESSSSATQTSSDHLDRRLRNTRKRPPQSGLVQVGFWEVSEANSQRVDIRSGGLEALSVTNCAFPLDVKEAMWPARCQILNPQPNPQKMMSCATFRYFGSPR